MCICSCPPFTDNNLNFYSIALGFQDNCNREPSYDNHFHANPPKKSIKMKYENHENEEESKNLNVLIEITNISENDKKKYIISNAYLKDISYYTKEDEVLVFPFTGFEVTGWDNYSFSKGKEKLKGTTFYFKFSKNYKELIKEKYD